MFGFKIHFHFLEPLSLSSGKEHAPAVPALSGFPRPDVEKSPTDLPLHPGANSFMFEDFENFEEFRVFLSILRILKTTKKSKKPPGSTQLYSIWDFHAFSQLSLEMELFDFHIKEG